MKAIAARTERNVIIASESARRSEEAPISGSGMSPSVHDSFGARIITARVRVPFARLTGAAGTSTSDRSSRLELGGAGLQTPDELKIFWQIQVQTQRRQLHDFEPCPRFPGAFTMARERVAAKVKCDYIRRRQQ